MHKPDALDKIVKKIHHVFLDSGISAVRPRRILPAAKPLPLPQQINRQSIAGFIDHTLLRQDATVYEIKKLCEEANEFGFAAVCVNPYQVRAASEYLKESSVGICAVVGFHLGASTPLVKAVEAMDAVYSGANEIDMVMNIGALKSGEADVVAEDIRVVREATRGMILKVIIETAVLSKTEIIKACRIVKDAKADFVKTSTGFSSQGATAEDVKLIRETVGPDMGIKASGGIKTFEFARILIEAGATRIGTTNSVAMVTGRDGG